MEANDLQDATESADSGLDERIWLTPEQVAQRFQLDDALVHRLIGRGTLEAVKFEGEWRISHDAVISYCARFSAPKRRRASFRLAAIAAVCAATLAISGFLFAQSAPARESFVLPYQGYLEEAGAPAEGDKYVTFRLFQTAEGGTPVWTEGHAVRLSAGRFTANLGETTSLDAVMRANSSLYLELSVDGADGGTPSGNAVALGGRQLFGSVPFARRGAPGKDFVVDGRVGIGTTVPATQLDVVGTTRLDGDLSVGQGTKRQLTVSGNVTVGDNVEAGNLNSRGQITATSQIVGANGRADCGPQRFDFGAGSCNTLWPNQTACHVRICDDCGCGAIGARRIVVEGN